MNHMDLPMDYRDAPQHRTPPHSQEAESSVLGGLLLENGAFDRIGKLDPSDFYFLQHQLIFGAIAALIGESKPADVITVFDWLETRGKKIDGGIEYINDLAQYVPSAANIAQYSKMIKDRALKRKLLETCTGIEDLVHEARGKPVDEILDAAEARVFNLAQSVSSGTGAGGFKNIDSLMAGMLEQVEKMADSKDGMVGTPSGFYDLDKMTSGLQGGDLIVVAARPSMGKTAIALNIAEHVAINEQLPVAVFSMEMGAGQLAVRVVGSVGRINQSNLRTGRLTDDEWQRLVETVERLRSVPLNIDETASTSIGYIRSQSRRLARQNGGKLGLVVVDYLQLMCGSGGGRDDNRATELGEMSRGLKLLAKELNCPVIALSQLNRSVEQRTDKRPIMSDLRESGAIEQDADIIMFIYRDEYYTKEACKEPGVAEVIIAKQRNGPTGVVKLAFQGAITKFDNLSSGG